MRFYPLPFFHLIFDLKSKFIKSNRAQGIKMPAKYLSYFLNSFLFQISDDDIQGIIAEFDPGSSSSYLFYNIIGID